MQSKFYTVRAISHREPECVVFERTFMASSGDEAYRMAHIMAPELLGSTEQARQQLVTVHVDKLEGVERWEHDDRFGARGFKINADTEQEFTFFAPRRHESDGEGLWFVWAPKQQSYDATLAQVLEMLPRELADYALEMHDDVYLEQLESLRVVNRGLERKPGHSALSRIRERAERFIKRLRVEYAEAIAAQVALRPHDDAELPKDTTRGREAMQWAELFRRDGWDVQRAEFLRACGC